MWLTEDFFAKAIAGIGVDAGEIFSDIHRDGEYRANLAHVMAKKAMMSAE